MRMIGRKGNEKENRKKGEEKKDVDQGSVQRRVKERGTGRQNVVG